MVTVKDFSKGNKAYSLIMNRGRKGNPTIVEVEVTKVGRTYVTTGIGYSERKYRNWDAEYLYEKVDFGESAMLFKTKEEAENYIEKTELSQWLGWLSVSEAEKFSLEQLRKVKEILNEK